VQRLFATPNGRKSKQEYSIIIDIIENSRNRIMFLWPFALFNSEASFSKQFRKVSTQTLATVDPFLPFFSDLLGF
jgi:hypothetical protein